MEPIDRETLDTYSVHLRDHYRVQCSGWTCPKRCEQLQLHWHGKISAHFKYPNVADIKDNPLVSVDHSPIVVVVPSNAPIGRPVIILYWY